MDYLAAEGYHPIRLSDLFDYLLTGKALPTKPTVLTFDVAYTIWMLDESGVWCSPTSWLQGHAVWHPGSALAVGLLYL